MLPLLERLLALEEVELLDHLDAHALLDLARSTVTECFTDGMAVVHIGERADSLFVVVQGEVVIRNGADEIVRIGPSEVFGASVLAPSAARGTAWAKGDLVCLSMTRSAIYRAIYSERDPAPRRRRDSSSDLVLDARWHS